jgi:hypothetical protein
MERRKTRKNEERNGGRIKIWKKSVAKERRQRKRERVDGSIELYKCNVLFLLGFLIFRKLTS